VSLVLVDTSVWIELLNGRTAAPPGIDPQRFVTRGPVVQEVLQGLRQNAESRRFTESFAAVPCLADPLPRHLFAAAADIYRSGRRRGYTIRSSVDCLIAAIAVEYEVPVWHRDRGFDAIAGYTPLQTVDTSLPEH
jgi:hypothetical protein